MDDLDHCVHIAECDWHSFYEETEECCLLQPALAGQDDSCLSDSDDSGRPVCSVPDTDPHEPGQNTEPNAKVFREQEQVWPSCTLLPLQSCPSGLAPPESHRPSEVKIDHSQRNAISTELIPGKSAEQHAELITKSLTDHRFIEHVIAEPVKHEPSSSGSSNYVDDTISGPFHGAHNASVLTVLKTVGDARQREDGTSGVFSTGHIPQSASTHCQHTEISMNLDQLCCPDGAACKRDSCEASGAEKERWFVTVNDSPVRHRPKAPLGKKKKRKKKPHKGFVHRASMSESQDPPDDSGPEIDKDGVNYSEGEDITQPYNNSIAQSNSPILPQYSHPALVSDLPQMTMVSSPPLRGEPSVELPMEITDSSKSGTIESFTDSEKSENNSSAFCPETPVTHGDMAFTQRNENAPQMDGIDSEHLNDDTEFFSTASYDSEDYISTEEPQNEAQFSISQMTQSLSDYSLSASNSSPIAEANLQSLVEEDYSRCAFPRQGEGYESTADQAYIEPDKTCPCSDHNDSIMPEVNSIGLTSDSQLSSLSNTMMEETGHSDNDPPTECDILTRASVVRDDARPPPNPAPHALTATPCSVSESSETLPDELGPTRPVYAISAFWDEMEKLTINDILQLRITRIPSPTREVHTLPATANAQVDFTETHMENSCLVDTAEYVLPDGTLMDTSDAADSDYCTHIDDSKPDRSSCEFSTFSDFDEEYYLQFASTNPSPEPQGLKLQSEISTESPYLTGSLHEEHVDHVANPDTIDVEQLTVQRSEDCIQNPILSGDNAFLRGLTKNKSLHNVQALGMEMLRDVSVNSISEEAEGSVILNTYQALEDNPFLDVNSRIIPRTRTPSPILANTDILDEQYKISFPEVFEYLFADDEPNHNFHTLLSVYDALQRPQYSEGEPVPIFSCSHIAARDLTFPELEDLLFPHDICAQSEEEEDDDSSPIRVVTCNDIQANLATSSLASDGYRHIFTRQSWRGDWRNCLSLRKIHFMGKGSSWCCRSGAWMFPPVPQRKTSQSTEVIDETRISSLQVIPRGQQQRRFKAIQTTISVAKEDGPLFTLNQSDLCLVCIAFASWVLRSSDPQATDAWKTALLANVSAISAIQYLRRYMRRRPTEEEQ